MRKKSLASLRKLPLTQEEWEEIKRYRRVPFTQKLVLLDRMRSFLFDVWKSNPKALKIQERLRKG